MNSGGLLGGLGSLGACDPYGQQQAALQNLYQTYTSGTTSNVFTFIPGAVVQFQPPPAAAPPDSPEVRWLKGQIEKVCWKP